jgi:two-component system cell cycle response regulator DivK
MARLNPLNLHVVFLTECEKRGLVVHQEGGHAAEKTRLARRLPDAARFDAGYGKKPAHELRLRRQPGKYRDRKLLRSFFRRPVCPGLVWVFHLLLRLFKPNRHIVPYSDGDTAAGYSYMGIVGQARKKQGSQQNHMPKQVMIVEDNELNMKLFRDLIEASGYKTIQTRNGMEALDLARKHRPDLILMDIQLPEVSGLEVTKWLKEDDELHTIPVIAVTAFAMKGDEERIRQGGCEAYVSKPISVPKFLETIKTYLGDA